MTQTPAPASPALHPLLAERWSPRAYDATHELGDEHLTALLEAARWAPSAVNRQPWRFLVGRRGDETFKGVFDALLPGNQLWAGSASTLVVGLAATHDAAGEPMRHAAYELGLSIAQLTVQAHALGLHVHQMAGFSTEALNAEFDVPAGYEAYIVLAIGRMGDPEELPETLRLREQAVRERKPLPEIAYARRWGEPALAGAAS